MAIWSQSSSGSTAEPPTFTATARGEAGMPAGVPGTGFSGSQRVTKQIHRIFINAISAYLAYICSIFGSCQRYMGAMGEDGVGMRGGGWEGYPPHLGGTISERWSHTPFLRGTMSEIRCPDTIPEFG